MIGARMAAKAKQAHLGVPTLVWLRPAQASLVSAVAGRAGLRIVAAGSPPTGGRGGETPVLEGLDEAERFSDLRQALTSSDAAFVLIAAPLSAGAVGDPVEEERELLGLLRSKERAAATLEPLPGAASRAPADGATAGGLPAIVPLLRDAPVMRAAMEAFEPFGPARTLTISMRSGAGHGSLAARLVDAALLVQTMLGEPESIDASVVTPVSASGVHEAPPTSLARLHGDLTANIRFAGARAASLSLSDRAGRWFRGLTLIGEKGCLRLDESGFDLTDPDGAVVDSTKVEGTKRPKGEAESVDGAAAGAIAEAVVRLLDARAQAAAPVDLAGVLAIGEAALLSARTGQGESPSTILRMARSA